MDMRSPVVKVEAEIAPYLMLRGVADAFFDKLEAKSAESITLDFRNVHSISRSFAHQYLLRKEASRKQIIEINVEKNVAKMLELVKSQIANNTRRITFSGRTARVIVV